MEIYAIVKKPKDYCVQNKKTGKVVFYGTKEECKEWIEHNGHDEWN